MQYDIQSMYGISGEVAIISGAAGGIGEEVAVAMGCLGAMSMPLLLHLRIPEKV